MINIIFSLFVCIFNADATASADDRNVEAAAEDPKHPILLTDKAVQAYYETMRFNCEDSMRGSKSMMLHVCEMLSKSDLFQGVGLMAKTDIALILYTLTKESESDAEGLVKTFRDGDNQVSQKNDKVIYAFGLCVPKFKVSDIEGILKIHRSILESSDEYGRARSVNCISRRYAKLKKSNRFSSELKTILWNIYPQFANPDSQLAIKASQKWLTGKSAKKYYEMLETNLAKEDIAAERSVLLQVCGALAHSDCFQHPKVFLQAEIETVLYLLYLKSSRYVETLANIFSQESYQVSSGASFVLHAFGRCVPAVRGDDLKEILDSFSDVYKKDEVVSSIKRRYQLSGFQGAKRFHPALKKLLWGMREQFTPQYAQPLPQPMSGAAVPNFYPHWQFTPQYAQPLPQPMSGAAVPNFYPHWQFTPQYAQPLPQPMSGAVPNFCPHRKFTPQAAVPNSYPHREFTPQAAVPNFCPHRQSAMRHADFVSQSQTEDLESALELLLPSDLFEEGFAPQSQTEDLESELELLLPANLFEEGFSPQSQTEGLESELDHLLPPNLFEEDVR